MAPCMGVMDGISMGIQDFVAIFETRFAGSSAVLQGLVSK